MLALFTQITQLYRKRTTQCILGCQIPFLDERRLNILRIYIEGSPVVHTAPAEPLHGGSWHSRTPRSGRDSKSSYCLNERRNRCQPLVGRIPLKKAGRPITSP